jgi:hypothetical protein
MRAYACLPQVYVRVASIKIHFIMDQGSKTAFTSKISCKVDPQVISKATSHFIELWTAVGAKFRRIEISHYTLMVPGSPLDQRLIQHLSTRNHQHGRKTLRILKKTASQ